ncbi:replication initiator protein A [Singulisphaera acidiphila]|uniref:Replication initiator protein A n=1 Tax=Singulisphaera acidiphila (strain ATCC BAA-1392 / DSM 18658 / VKM B-2454 / MOB10) TaxID=886293 RepID=L0DRJ9_SINAD|nr:replication initiator protein A [Singulisphaera acidiphila]AGA31607.1 Replication initiator protein A [Singulisphaera acidiphila DSM 18658]
MDDWDQSIEETARIEPVAERTSAFDAGWKDELNLAEFPIAALTDRIPDGQTTLVFEDKLECRDSAPIVRRLTIMGTHKHGLPTSLDDEVLVGLIQLTKRRNNFTEAKVGFSRYELIELLGWPQSGQSYRRIEEALHRWVGVVLMYENAWWDNNAKSWVDENFHVLDNVTLYDRERRRPAPRSGKPLKAEKAPLPLSSFRWNEVIFQSFQSGNLKQLDLEFYLRLRLPTTKRMFRFLDKRFYRRSRLDFDLRTMACEHIGMSRSYAPTELKRRLKPALEELEQLGFLEPLSLEERYSYVKRGCWRIILIRGKAGQADESPMEETSELIEVLKARGVSAKIAADLVEAHPSGRIQTKVDVFDWLLRNGDKRVGKNPAGYLVASIRADYQAPGDFPTAATTEAKAAATEVEQAAEESGRQARRRARDDSERDQARETELRAAWDRLHDAERETILAEVKDENPGLGRWKKMLEPLCLVALEKRLGTTKAAQGTLFPDGGPDA